MSSDDAEMFDERFKTQLDSLLQWRRDVRRFQSSPLSETLIAEILSSTALAPSVGNSQPCRLVRVRSASLRAARADHVDEQIAQAADSYDDTRRAAYAALKLHGLREAPEILAVFSDSAVQAGHGLGSATMPETLLYSTVMAIHTLWLAARARGVGLGWVSIVQPRRMTILLDVPAEWQFVALLCLGFPEDTSTVPELHRLGWQRRENWEDRLFDR